jgi:beta-fructofuranosidase
MRPVKELEMLRGQERTWAGVNLADGAANRLEGVRGDSCELEVEIDPGASTRCGLKVRASPDGAEQTLLGYEPTAKQLLFDATRSGGAGRKVVERAPFELQPGEPLTLRVFVDKSVVEVYANDRQAIGRRVYPARPDSLGVFLFSEGNGAVCRKVRAWDMAPSNPY